YEALSDWNSLAELKTGITAGIASTYDQSGGNLDYNWYEWPEGFQDSRLQVEESIPTRVVTLAGPGILSRFQMPHAAANGAFTLKMTVDGTLAIDTNSDAFLDGSYLGALYGDAGGKSPLATALVGGQFSYEPIAFQESLVIESNNFRNSGDWAKSHHYYQYNYHQFPAGTSVTPYTGSLTAAQQAARTSVITMIDQVGSNPAGPPIATVLDAPGQSIPAGATLTLADLAGSGQVRRLNLKMAAATDTDLDGLRLRVRYDDQPENAIDVPVAHFFGAGHERVPYKSLPLGTDGPDGFYSYWPMPYRRGVVIELVNTTGAPVTIGSAAVEYEPGLVPADRCYLHAIHREETTSAGQADYQILNAAGSGHYVGSLLYVARDGTSRNILEGDDIIVVDGHHVLYGTGIEDGYNGGYYFNHVLDQSDDGDVPDPESGTGPYSGLLHMDDQDFGDTSFRSDQYRWLIPDYVPFTESVNATVENYLKGADVLFGSTAFYYLLPEAGTLVWTGAAGNTWDGGQAANWSQGGSPRAYWDGDHVIFDDTAPGSPLVEITDTVTPGSVLVDGDAVHFEFAGAGSIAGPCGLTKNGGGALTIATSNAYTGETRINAGTLLVAAEDALGASAVRLGDTTGSNDASLLAAVALTVDRDVTVQDDGSGAPGRTLGGTHTAGAAVFSGRIAMEADLFLTAEPGGTVQLAGALDNPDGHTLTKIGGGTAVVDCIQTHGPGALLEIEEGTVYLNTDAGSAGAANLRVSVTGAELHVGSDQHLETLAISDGGLVRFTGAHTVVVKHLVMDGVDFGAATLTPEPATLALVTLGGLAALVRRRGKQADRHRH
ncbi:MAG TPA: DUF2961 domain-containing protein, partial [Phycisphaerae bacterium]|nr:DUF2961 domain-containing protein [Phycisphaerae bacterium]